MTFKVLKYLKNLVRLILNRVGDYLTFIILNNKFILSKRVEFDSFPFFNQTCRLTGEGKVFFGRKCVFGYKFGGFYYGGSIEFQPRYKNAAIKIGNNVSTNNNVFICSANLVEIGDETLIGQNVTIMDFEAHDTDPNNRKSLGEIGKVIIGKNVWIGNNVTILKNTEIGDNSIIAAGAVVSGVFPKNIIIGGIPAKKIKDLTIE